MFPKKLRIHRRRDILFVLRKGRAIQLEIGVARVKENTLGYPRASVIVPNTVSKKATVRNVIKRRIREALRKEIFPHLQSIDVIIIAKGQAVNASYQTITANLRAILERGPVRK